MQLQVIRIYTDWIYVLIEGEEDMFKGECNRHLDLQDLNAQHWRAV